MRKSTKQTDRYKSVSVEQYKALSYAALSETQHQRILIVELRLLMPIYPELKLLYAVPNGGWRDGITAKTLEAEGVKAGVSDLVLPVARGGFFGLYLELKKIDGTPTAAQKLFTSQLIAEGYKATFEYGWKEAFNQIINYVQLPKTKVVL